ncbi:hypothetical protein EDD15DRAFT_2516141 [Pisolithus albus]|nr:hypothetical protein EDD15DRAFT_2516141 [Pisolithus albus]
MYYMHYSEDTSAIRFLVSGIWILSTLHFSFVCHFLHYYLITNYGNPTSLLYMVWSEYLPSSKVLPVDEILQVIASLNSGACVCGYCSSRASVYLSQLDAHNLGVFSFFIHQIHHLCRPQLKWWATAPTMLLTLAGTGCGMATAILKFLKTETSLSTQILLHIGTPALALYMLAEIMIAVWLCTLLYDSSSHSSFPRTKCLLNTLIIYAVNRCLLAVLVTIAEVVTDVSNQVIWTIALDFICQGVYSSSLLASLNTRQYLRSQASSTISDLRVAAVNFPKLSKLEGDVGSSEDGTKRFGVSDEGVIDITADPALRKEVKV